MQDTAKEGTVSRLKERINVAIKENREMKTKGGQTQLHFLITVRNTPKRTF